LPSEAHAALYDRLMAITRQVREALENETMDDLPRLAEIHQRTMTELRQAGDCRDPDMLETVEKVRQTVYEVQEMMTQARDHIAGKLRIQGNRQKLNKAYGNR